MVLLISVASLLMTGYYSSRYKVIYTWAEEGVNNCYKLHGGNRLTMRGIIGTDNVCDAYIKQVYDLEWLMRIGLIVGIGLPIFFFGKKAFLNYIVLEKKKIKYTLKEYKT